MAGYIPRRFTCRRAVTHPSSNRAQCRLTTLIQANGIKLRNARYAATADLLSIVHNVRLKESNDVTITCSVDRQKKADFPRVNLGRAKYCISARRALEELTNFRVSWLATGGVQISRSLIHCLSEIPLRLTET